MNRPSDLPAPSRAANLTGEHNRTPVNPFMTLTKTRLSAFAVMVAGMLLALSAGPVHAEDNALPVGMWEISVASRALKDLRGQSANPLLDLAQARLLILSGATLETDDPWQVHEILNDAVSGNATADRVVALEAIRLDAAGRGSVTGPTRHDVMLEPEGEVQFELTFSTGEYALVEVRLRGNSPGADVDLVVTRADGHVIASDTGPTTGIEGFAAYVEWLPENCDAVQVSMRNISRVPVSIVFLAPATREGRCAS